MSNIICQGQRSSCKVLLLEEVVDVELRESKEDLENQNCASLSRSSLEKVCSNFVSLHIAYMCPL